MNARIRIALVVCLAATMLTSGTIAYALIHDEEDHEPPEGVLSSFASYEDFARFVKDAEEANEYNSSYGDAALMDGGDSSESSYSTTNVQVEGVDEADIVKTDGEYIYAVSWDRVSIIDAVPADSMEVVTVLTKNDILGFELECSVQIVGLYVVDDKLVVVMNVHEYSTEYPYCNDTSLLSMPALRHRTVVSVFDVGDASSPELVHSLGVSGHHRTTRMIGDTVYLVAQSYIFSVDDDPRLPSVWDFDVAEPFDPAEVFYDDGTRYIDNFVNLLAVDVVSGEYDHMGVVTGYASTVYMSLDALYFTYQKWFGDIILLADEAEPEEEDTTWTTIHKISVDGLGMTAAATGEVEGWLLDQFSMDEDDGMLRVATTTSWSEPENNVYVLDEDLERIGSVEGLAPTERIYSARFMGDTLYLVTFLQIDPLFVIDLSDPTSPEVVGELKVPGFSSYLHPVGEGLLLGIGREDGRVKLSLFDVSDPTNPVERDKFVADGYSWTEAMSDHKAVLFDPERQMLVIPVNMYDYESIERYYTFGAWVFDVSGEDGISLRGTIEHDEFRDYDPVRRSMYIDDVLYTLSYVSVKSTSLPDLSGIGALPYADTSSW